MKVAVIADVHSNYVALEHTYQYLVKSKVDQVIFLGDLLTDCPYPIKTIKVLKKFEKRFKTNYCKGNREEYILNLDMNLYNEDNLSSLVGSIYYTKLNLREKDLDFIKKLKPAGVLVCEDLPKIFYCHALPDDTRQGLYPGKEETNFFMLKNEYNYILTAHTHQSFTYTYHKKTLINPGSLGIFEEGKKHARFVILESNSKKTWDVNHIELAYDTKPLIDDFYKSEILRYGKIYSMAIIDSFKTGYNRTSDIVALAFRLKKKEEIEETDFISAYSMLHKDN